MAKSFVRFSMIAAPRRKTAIWQVISEQGGELLGQIEWFSHWRQYTFFPTVDTLYNPVCLEQIAAFCRSKTLEQRENAKTLKWLASLSVHSVTRT